MVLACSIRAELRTHPYQGFIMPPSSIRTRAAVIAVFPVIAFRSLHRVLPIALVIGAFAAALIGCGKKAAPTVALPTPTVAPDMAAVVEKAMQQGLQLLDADLYDQAIAEFDSAMALQPDYAPA